MSTQPDPTAFAPINAGYNDVFLAGQMSVGLVVPIETYADGPVPDMRHHLKRVRLAEELGFSAVWLRDVPFNVPSFGDAGQIYDPFVYLGLLAGQTTRIALGVSSIVLPLRHPAHVAKAAASVDDLSDGRLILGVASGDRPDEYPALNVPFAHRGERFRDSFDYISRMATLAPAFQNALGSPGGGIDMLPKPTAGRLPLLITGASQQDPDWIAREGDGWMLYPRDARTQAAIIADWRDRIASLGQPPRPVMQPLYIDLDDNPTAPARPLHLGYRLGIRTLREHLTTLREIGVNHVALNLRFNSADTEQTLHRIADDLLPHFTHP